MLRRAPSLHYTMKLKIQYSTVTFSQVWGCSLGGSPIMVWRFMWPAQYSFQHEQDFKFRMPRRFLLLHCVVKTSHSPQFVSFVSSRVFLTSVSYVCRRLNFSKNSSNAATATQRMLSSIYGRVFPRYKARRFLTRVLPLHVHHLIFVQILNYTFVGGTWPDIIHVPGSRKGS